MLHQNTRIKRWIFLHHMSHAFYLSPSLLPHTSHLQIQNIEIWMHTFSLSLEQWTSHMKTMIFGERQLYPYWLHINSEPKLYSWLVPHNVFRNWKKHTHTHIHCGDVRQKSKQIRRRPQTCQKVVCITLRSQKTNFILWLFDLSQILERQRR